MAEALLSLKQEEFFMNSSKPITSLKGIGEKTGQLFEKLGIRTVEDLLEYYPRGYDAYESPVPIGNLQQHDHLFSFL